MADLKLCPPAAAAAPVPRPIPARAVVRSERVFSVFLWLYVPAAWLALLILPAAPPTSTLDGSWQAILHYAAARHWQSGVEIVFTYGPLGYLQCAGIYTAETWVECVVYQLLFKAFYVGVVAHLARRLARPHAVAFLLLNTLLPLLNEEALYLLAVSYGGIVLGGSTRADRWWSVPAVVFLAAAALMKTVLLVYGGFMLACVGVTLFAGGRWREGWTVLGGFAGCFLALYAGFGGQRLANLPAYLRNSQEIVAGYPAAMATLPGNPEAWCIFVVFGLAAWRLWHAARSSGVGGWARWSALLVCAAGLFIAWRQGYTRADPNHQITTFIYAVCLASAATLFLPPGFKADGRTTAGVPELLLSALIVFQYQNRPMGERVTPAQRVATTCRWLFTPAAQHAHLETLAARADERDALPRCRAAVGDASVDLFGCAQTILLRGGYDYRPAPVCQPYIVYTPRLMELNAAFYRSERAPEFVLFNPVAIDNRFPNLENAPVLALLLRHYQPVLAERGFLLLRRRPASAQADDEARTLLAEGELHPGEKLALPPGDGPVWCELDWQPNLPGRLAGLVFQPPRCGLDVFGPETVPPVGCRLIPGMARGGFLLTPVVDSPAGFLQVLAGRAQDQKVTAIRVASGPAASLMRSTIWYRLYRLPPFPATQGRPEPAATDPR